MSAFITLFLDKKLEVLLLFIDHMNMTTIAVAISLLIGVPLGIFITRNKKFAAFIIGIANLMQSIPSIALLAFAVPFVGIGEKPAIVMVLIYSLLPMIKNTFTGISSIDPKVIEAAKGIGLSSFQLLTKVQLPIAMPFIMAGIRISAVAAVGTMTIAAFAGAGGLGWFINLGLNSGSPQLVLLGAIPASLLALAIDYLLAKLERIMTSEGLKAPEFIHPMTKKQQKMEKYIVISLCGLLVFGPFVASSASRFGSGEEKKITVGTSNYTEAIVLGYIYTELIEANTEIKVEKKFNLNGAVFAFQALEHQQIDTVVAYTGGTLANVLHQPLQKDPDVVWNIVQAKMKEQYQVHVSEPLGFNNTYLLSVRPNIAEKYGLHKLSDVVARANQLRIGCTVEFIQRADCLPGLEKEYNIEFKAVKGLDSTIRYQAIEANEVDIIDAYSTDGLLKKLNLVALEDDIGFFPPYYAITLTRMAVFEQYPELEPLFAKLENSIDDEAMRTMNYQVDVEGMDAKDVAHAFLLKKGYI